MDDSALFLSSAKHLLSAVAELEVVGEALSGPEALRQIETLRPDVVLLDIGMPGMDGIEVARIVKARPGAPHVVLVSLYDSDEYRRASAALQVDGFLAKTEFGTGVVPLLRALCR